MAEGRRIINKPGQKPSIPGAENIVVKPKGTEERVKEVETYLQQVDPILRTAVNDIASMKNLLGTLNEEITKIAGIQSRSNNFIESKFAEINATFGAIVSVVKKIDDDYHALFVEEGVDIPSEEQEPSVEPDVPDENEELYSDDDLYSDDAAETPEPVPVPEELKIIDVKPIPKSTDKKKK